MTGRHAPAPTYPSRLWLAIMAAAVAGIVVPPTVLAARAVAPQVAAVERLALTPERSAEPSAHGGPLAPLSIGVVAPETNVPVVPPIVRSSRPAQRPVAVVSSVRVAGTTPAVATPPTVTTAPGIATPVETTTPPTTTAAATTTRPCRWCHHHTSPATTTETTTAATTTEATETTSEPIETLISDVLQTTSEETP